MKRKLDNILNSRRKSVKVTGTIVANPSHLTYVLATRNGRMKVDATTAFKLGDRVVAFDRLIQGYAGNEPPATMEEV